GPALQPHQLFSRSTAWLLGLSIAVAAIMRLKWAVTVRGVAELFCNAMPVPRPVMVEDEMPAAAMGPITSRPLSPAPLSVDPLMVAVLTTSLAAREFSTFTAVPSAVVIGRPVRITAILLAGPVYMLVVRSVKLIGLNVRLSVR